MPLQLSILSEKECWVDATTVLCVNWKSWGWSVMLNGTPGHWFHVSKSTKPHRKVPKSSERTSEKSVVEGSITKKGKNSEMVCSRSTNKCDGQMHNIWPYSLSMIKEVMSCPIVSYTIYCILFIYRTTSDHVMLGRQICVCLSPDCMYQCLCEWLYLFVAGGP